MKVECDSYESTDFMLGRASPFEGAKTSSESPCMGIDVASPRSCDVRLDAGGPEKRGAGGSGLRGLPPYFEDGVPGRGPPCKSAGSYGIFAGGGREDSDDVRESNDRVGDRELLLGLYGIYGGALLIGGGMFGAVSRMEGDGGLEDWDDVDG